MINFKHLPKYFGEVKTDKGAGFVVELIRDFDGEVSKTFEYYLKKDGVLKYKKDYLYDYSSKTCTHRPSLSFLK